MFKCILPLIFSLMLLIASTAYAGSKDLTFEWDQVISQDFAGWTLYQSDAAGGPYTKVTDIDYDPNSTAPYQALQPLTSPDGQEKTFYFVMTARDSNGNESVYSEEVSYTADFLSPDSPFQLKILIQSN